MKCWIRKLLFTLLFVSPVYASPGWEDTFTAIDGIIFNIEQLENSNNSLQLYNMSLQKIINEQKQSLIQWENNWTLTQEHLQALNSSLSDYEKKLKFYRIFTPVAIVTTAAVISGISIWISKR